MHPYELELSADDPTASRGACATVGGQEARIPITHCRVCGHALFAAPVLRQVNMPKAAQHLPGPEDLGGDRGVDMNIRQCAGCGLVQLDSDPVPYYRDVIRASAVSAEMRAFRRQQFTGVVSAHGLSGKAAIEIGCGRGEYLSILNESGLVACGLEYADDAVAQANAAGLRVTKGYIGDASCEVAGAPFDAFFILSFLEHLPDINAVLAGIRRLLVAGGVGVVEVPNFDMMLRNNLFSEFVTDHLYYFTENTLRTTLRVNGFDVVTSSVVWHDYIISAIVRKRAPLDVSRFDACRVKLKEAIDAYLARFGPRRVAIWGAGHQALAVMALADLSGRVAYVVDSAPFKQGRYTPATHIPIVAPDRLAGDPPEAVIVMAGSYSDEVVRTIRSRFATIAHVAVLRESALDEQESRRV